MRRWIILLACFATNAVTFPILYRGAVTLFTVVCAGTLTGCAEFATRGRNVDYPIELKFYVDHYLSNRAKYLEPGVNKSIKIRFSELKDPHIGWCTSYDFHGDILLDTTWWNASDDEDRLELMYHEMGALRP